MDVFASLLTPERDAPFFVSLSTSSASVAAAALLRYNGHLSFDSTRPPPGQVADGVTQSEEARMRTVLTILALVVAFVQMACAQTSAHDYRDKNFDYFVSGDPSKARAAHTEYGVALMGGGGSVDAAFKMIADRAGHGHIVILRAVSDDSFDPDDGSYGKKFVGEWGPVASAETITFHNRAASSDPRVLKALHDADGIFLAGGDQANYVRYWKGTGVQAALDAHVKANRPIGGSSAGLAILGHYSYTAFDGGSMESKVALANPFDSGVTLEDDFLHIRNLESVITDTHFSRRSRLGRLITFVARLQNEKDKNVIGIGVDEKTALLVDANGTAHLAAGSAGSAWMIVPREHARLKSGHALTMHDIALTRIDADSMVELHDHAVKKPGAAVTLKIDGGRLSEPSIASKILQRDAPPKDES
jgi:cyanophycinase